MTDVVPYTTPRPPSTSSFDAEWLLDPAEIAQRIGGTDFVPVGLRGNPAAITAALLYGSEVGLGRMQSLAKIAVINGRPTLAAEAQRALILAAGHDLWIEESNTTRCTVCGRRRGSDAVSRVTWTIDDAKRAGLAQKAPWRSYPRQMLLARASAELARAVFPDAIGGLLATEELDDDPNVAQTANGDLGGPETAPRPSTRRRRANVTATPESTPPDAPEPEPPEPLLMNPAQRPRMMAGFTERGMTDRAERLAFSSRVIGRDIESSAELTVAEASQIIDALADETAYPAPGAADDATAPTPAASPFQAPPGVGEPTGELPADEQAVLEELGKIATEIPPSSGS